MLLPLIEREWCDPTLAVGLSPASGSYFLTLAAARVENHWQGDGDWGFIRLEAVTSEYSGVLTLISDMKLLKATFPLS